MAIANTTTASDLIDPEVYAAYIQAQLPYNIHLRPLCEVNTDLQGAPGSTITVPKYTYMGDAATLAELADVPLKKLGVTTQTVTVAKIANGYGLSDEAVLNSGGSPDAEGTRQLVQSFGQTVDGDIYAKAVAGAAHSVAEAFTIDGLIANMSQFGEWEPSQFAGIVLSPAMYGSIAGDARLTDASAAGQPSSLVTGISRALLGVPIIMSKRATGGALVVKRNALGLAIKRDVLVERDRDTINFSTIVTASMHYAAYVQSADGVMKFAADGTTPPEEPEA